jgi:hypothetical protein
MLSNQAEVADLYKLKLNICMSAAAGAYTVRTDTFRFGAELSDVCVSIHKSTWPFAPGASSIYIYEQILGCRNMKRNVATVERSAGKRPLARLLPIISVRKKIRYMPCGEIGRFTFGRIN